MDDPIFPDSHPPTLRRIAELETEIRTLRNSGVTLLERAETAEKRAQAAEENYASTFRRYSSVLAALRLIAERATGTDPEFRMSRVREVARAAIAKAEGPLIPLPEDDE